MAQLNSTIVSGDMRVTDDMSATTVKSTRNNQLLIGTGTAASASGSTYYPAKWTFNTGVTINNGDIISIKIPVGGHDYGVYVSIDNGSHYYPVVTNSTGRLTSHFGVSNCISLIFESDGSCASVFPVAGGGSRVTVTGGAFRVINFYDSNSNTYDRNLHSGTIKCGANAIVAANIIVGKDGVYHHLKDGTAFDITYPILYAASAIAANATGANNYDVIPFTVTTTQSISLTLYLPVYIKGTLSGTTFTPVSTTPLTQTVPTTADGYYYMLLGDAYSATTIYLNLDHRIFAYKNGKFGEISNSAIYADTAGSATDSTKVAKAGDTMTGCLAVTSTQVGNYNEGIRINRTSASNAAATLLIGGAANSTTGITDGAFWIGAMPTGTNIRKLWITHNGSNNGSTYFIASSSSDYSPALNLGTSGTVSSGDTKAVTGGVVYTALTNGTVTKVGTGTVGGTTTPIYLNAGTPTALSYTIAKSVPSDAVFTDTKVTQTATTTNANYEVLFSATADNTTRTEGTRKNSNLTFNPNTGLLSNDFYGSSMSITSRLTDFNFAASGSRTGCTKVRFDLMTSSATTGKVPISPAGYVHTYYWDSAAAMTQIYIPNGDHAPGGANGPQGLMIRGYDNDSTWKDWTYIPFMTTTPTSGQVVITDGTTGGVKSSGYTIAKSVPADAVFTDHTYNFSGTSFTSGNYTNGEHNANNIKTNGVYYYTSNGPTTDTGATTNDGGLYGQFYGTTWGGHIAQDYRNGNLFVRGLNNSSWTPWKPIPSANEMMGLAIMGGPFKFNPSTRVIMANKTTQAWDASVYSTYGFTNNVYVTFKPMQTNMAIMFGLNSDPTTDANYTGIDFCWYMQNDGKLNIYESNASVTTGKTYAVNDDLRIEYSNGYVRYYHNGVLLRSVARSVSKLYADSSFHGATGGVCGFEFGSMPFDANTVNGLTLSLVT